MNPSFLSVARQFAQALDRDDFSAASALLSENCVYDSPGDRLRGRVTIISSYQSNSEWASRTLDEIRYASSVADHDGKRMCITFTDYLKHGGRTHTYHCRQLLAPDDAGRIRHIEHVEIAGEREALDQFLRERGIERNHPPQPEAGNR